MRLPKRKAEIIRCIRHHPNSTQHEIANALGITHDAVRSHVYQINELLAGTDWEIRSQRLSRDGRINNGKDHRGDNGRNKRRRNRGQFSFVGYEVVKRRQTA